MRSGESLDSCHTSSKTIDTSCRVAYTVHRAMSENTQICHKCKNMPNCWAARIRSDHVVLNLLVCRLSRGIDINETSKAILAMIRPKLINLANRIVKSCNGAVAMDVAYADLQAEAIRHLQTDYMMGEVAFPLHYLFGAPHGALYLYAHNYAKREQRHQKTFLLAGDEEVAVWPSEEIQTQDDSDIEGLTAVVRSIIMDGQTLDSVEFRVMTHILDADENSSAVKRYLSEQMGISIIKVNRIYDSAQEKIRVAVLASTHRDEET